LTASTELYVKLQCKQQADADLAEMSVGCRRTFPATVAALSNSV
jgi:hypothetical protein